MKNYELIAKLMRYPAGYDVKFSRVILAEEHEEHSDLMIDESIEDIDISDTSEEIVLLS